jgi:hypothetical protein
VTYENSPLLRSLLTLVWSVVAQIGSLLTLLRIRQDCLAPVATSQSQGEVGASSARSKAQIFKSSLSFFFNIFGVSSARSTAQILKSSLAVSFCFDIVGASSARSKAQILKSSLSLFLYIVGASSARSKAQILKSSL